MTMIALDLLENVFLFVDFFMNDDIWNFLEVYSLDRNQQFFFMIL